MNHFIIDGNNLVGKIIPLRNLQKKSRTLVREKLVSLLNSYFAGKKVKISLHFDGFEKGLLNLTKGKIFYSDNKSSDDLIRKEIEKVKNSKLINLVTSDLSLINFGRVNSCNVIKADEFSKLMESSSIRDEEFDSIRKLEFEKAEFLKLFQN